MFIGMNADVRRYFAEIGRRGGKKSRRHLDPGVARDMVRVRQARRAYVRFHAACFWSYDPEYRIGVGDLGWVVQTLRRNGGREAWEAAARLCP